VRTLVLAPFSDEGLVALERMGGMTYEPWTRTQHLHDPQQLGARVASEGFGALVVEADFLFDELFEAATTLRFAAICRSALNQVDLDAATAHGVAVVHTPGRNAQAVAELALAMMLSLARWLPQASDYLRRGEWWDPTEPYTRFQGRELLGATVGIIGLGEIGRRVARLARALRMRVLAYDPYVRPGGRGTAGVTLTTLEGLLRESDFVSVHVPETPETTGLLSARRLEFCKPTAYLVNVTAQAVVDAEALAAALREHRLAGAAMDVHEAHPIPPDSPFIGMPNVLLTPHIGGATVETVHRHSRMVVSDLEWFVAGNRPRHLANAGVWRRLRR